MALKQISFACPVCSAVTLHQKENFSGGLGCLLTVITGGFFFPVWLLIAIVDESKPFRCQQCGSPNASDTFLLRGVALAIVGAITLVVVLIAVGSREKPSDQKVREPIYTPAPKVSPESNDATEAQATPSVSGLRSIARPRVDYLDYLRSGMTLAETEIALGAVGNKIVGVGERSIYEFIAPNQQRIQCAFEDGRLKDFVEGDLPLRGR